MAQFESGLMGIWRFSETSGNNVTNHTGFSFTGVLSNGVSRSISTAPFRAEATTFASSNITSTSADLNGVVDPNNFSNLVYFSYGTSPALGTSTGTTNVGDGNSVVPVTIGISNLFAGTTYYAQIRAYGGCYEMEMTTP